MKNECQGSSTFEDLTGFSQGTYQDTFDSSLELSIRTIKQDHK